MRRLLLPVLILFAPLAVNAADCSVNFSATPVNFGNYDPTFGTPTQVTGTITVTCKNPPTPDTGTYSIALSTGASGSYAGRTMKLGSEVLNYQLYTDSTYSTVWGDGTGGSQAVSGSYQNLNDNESVTFRHTIYGRVPANQWPAAGNYTDTITATVTY